ncbi:hypothetical protein PCH_Pc13g10350 [Penicillium rubens Wisconsin 54-1255]|uniref:Uncharacterized protein n=1 Tax=Penicillium rubens (strain ATCC 28089 / DSM 1075 / NRRL 1951 / Wisconsin 54-1255) TaxID=500485 RepID=B6H4T5_PENRW|nr:hypothetical protein PCH_Pc13g10350 [Penicillium rubens Wisconsin 54-1255]
MHGRKSIVPIGYASIYHMDLPSLYSVLPWSRTRGSSVPWVLPGFELSVAVFGLGLALKVWGSLLRDIGIIRYCGVEARLVPDLCYQGLGFDRGLKPKGAVGPGAGAWVCFWQELVVNVGLRDDARSNSVWVSLLATQSYVYALTKGWTNPKPPPVSVGALDEDGQGLMRCRNVTYNKHMDLIRKVKC